MHNSPPPMSGLPGPPYAMHPESGPRFAPPSAGPSTCTPSFQNPVHPSQETIPCTFSRLVDALWQASDEEVRRAVILFRKKCLMGPPSHVDGIYDTLVQNYPAFTRGTGNYSMPPAPPLQHHGHPASHLSAAASVVQPQPLAPPQFQPHLSDDTWTWEMGGGYSANFYSNTPAHNPSETGPPPPPLVEQQTAPRTRTLIACRSCRKKKVRAISPVE
ncbi:hypothetical protein N658DRAFT_500105 [Parathielavia hyrcaniae]|uniref:Uncharacterized protein n=1 Tax=Parathielavia hyrcaniae TaxID=113614 RepID=A0AAN6SXT4_9PEZI|nr:hypothetical protein N658DRAFT_500105 [Parathielavia hyrcaniae]